MSQPPTGSGNLNPSKWDPHVIGLVGLICSIFLLFSYYKILERNCGTFRVIRLSRNRNRRRRLNEHLEEYSSQLQSRGLDSYIMHSLPVTQIIKKSRNDDEEESNGSNEAECAVCLGELEEADWVKHLPNCSHVFHVACIDTWFKTHSSCPLCRSYVCGISTVSRDGSSSIETHLFPETLVREDFHRERSQHYQVVVQNDLNRISG